MTLYAGEGNIGHMIEQVKMSQASIPKGCSTENMHLLLGEAVTEGKLTEGDSKLDSYVKPVAFWLPDEKIEVKSVLKDVQLFPYT